MEKAQSVPVQGNTAINVRLSRILKSQASLPGPIGNILLQLLAPFSLVCPFFVHPSLDFFIGQLPVHHLQMFQHLESRQCHCPLVLANRLGALSCRSRSSYRTWPLNL